MVTPPLRHANPLIPVGPAMIGSPNAVVLAMRQGTLDGIWVPFSKLIEKVEAIARNPCAVIWLPVNPSLRSAPFKVFSEIGRLAELKDGKMYPSPAECCRASCRMAIARRESGTWWSLPIFIFEPGITHIEFSKSTSCHSACRSSPGRTKTCGASRRARAVDGWPV